MRRSTRSNLISTPAKAPSALASTCATWRRRRLVAHVDASAEGAFAGVEIRFDRVERRILPDHDHDRRCQNRRQCRILETASEMLWHDDKTERARGTDRYRFHGYTCAEVMGTADRMSLMALLEDHGRVAAGYAGGDQRTEVLLLCALVQERIADERNERLKLSPRKRDRRL